MNIYQKELEKEITVLNARILECRRFFDEGLKSNKPLAELKPIYSRIKDLEKRLDFCFEESHVLKNP